MPQPHALGNLRSWPAPPPPPTLEGPSLFSRWKSWALSPLQPGTSLTLRAGAHPEALPKEAWCQKPRHCGTDQRQSLGTPRRAGPPRSQPQLKLGEPRGPQSSWPPLSGCSLCPGGAEGMEAQEVVPPYPHPHPRAHPGLAAHLALQGCQSSCAPRRTFASCSIWTAAGSVMLRRQRLITEQGVRFRATHPLMGVGQGQGCVPG